MCCITIHNHYFQEHSFLVCTDFVQAKTDIPKSVYPLNKQYKKYCIRYIPTLALPKSGYGSRPFSPLSACYRQAHLLSYSFVMFHKTSNRQLSDAFIQTFSVDCRHYNTVFFKLQYFLLYLFSIIP